MSKILIAAVVLVLALLPAQTIGISARLTGGGQPAIGADGTQPSTGTHYHVCTAIACPPGYVKDENCKCVPIEPQPVLGASLTFTSSGTSVRGCPAVLCPRGYHQAPDCQCMPDGGYIVP